MQQSDRSGWAAGWGGLLVLLLAVFALAPLTYPGFFQARSGFVPSFRVQHLFAGPSPWWDRPLFSIQGEGRLAYLLVWPVYWLTGSGTVAIRVGYALAFLVGALAVYAWTRRWFGLKGAVLSAVVYTYLPWHLSATYVRGAYAEAWLWGLWPLIPWALDGSGRRRRLTVAAAGLAAAAVTFLVQPGLAAVCLVVLIASGILWVVIWLWRAWGGVAVLLGTGLLVLAARFTPPLPRPFVEQLLYPFQLFSAAWSAGDLAFQLGVAAIGLTVISLALWRRSPSASLRRAMGFWLVVLVAVALLTLRPLAPVWRASGLDALLAQPWQVLAVAGLPLAFLAGSVMRLDERLATRPLWAGLVALVVLASYSYLAPRFTQVDPGPQPVAVFQPVQASSPQIVLLDAEFTPAAEITSTLTLTLTWQALEPVAEDYTVFVHLLAPEGSKVVQRDARPCDGQCPTDGWRPGEIVVDHHRLTLLPSSPPGPYRLAVGLYLLATGERAAVVGRDDGTVYFDVR